MFQQLALKVDYILRKFGITLSGQDYVIYGTSLYTKLFVYL